MTGWRFTKLPHSMEPCVPLCLAGTQSKKPKPLAQGGQDEHGLLLGCGPRRRTSISPCATWPSSSLATGLTLARSGSGSGTKSGLDRVPRHSVGSTTPSSSAMKSRLGNSRRDKLCTRRHLHRRAGTAHPDIEQAGERGASQDRASQDQTCRFLPDRDLSGASMDLPRDRHRLLQLARQHAGRATARGGRAPRRDLGTPSLWTVLISVQLCPLQSSAYPRR
nr:MAG: hypothetical protein [Totiviridae sp.]